MTQWIKRTLGIVFDEVVEKFPNKEAVILERLLTI